MHLMYYLSESGERVYTLKVRRLARPSEQHRFTHLFLTRSIPPFAPCWASQKETLGGKPTESAHPARFSPDDKFSKHRLICKKRFGLLPMQNKQLPL